MAPQLHQELINGLKRWQQDLPAQQTMDTLAAAKEQELLGWQNMVKGVLSTKWQEEQQNIREQHMVSLNIEVKFFKRDSWNLREFFQF